MHTANTITIVGTQVHFPHGDVTRVFRISDYTIVEYAKLHDGRVFYCAYVELRPAGVEYASLDQALFGALMHKYAAREDFQHRAITYLVRALGI